MLDSIFLLSASGEVMLEKQWMGRQVDRSVCVWFWSQRHQELQNGNTQAPNVLASPTHYVLNIVREGITFLACTKSEMSPLLGIEGRRRTLRLPWRSKRGSDQGQFCHCLSDEMMDSGFPLTTEPNILKEIISPPNLVSKVLSVVTGGASNVSSSLPLATASDVPWRGSGIKHGHNEICFDLVEEMDAVVNRDGFLKRCEVYGEVQASCRLSGMPEVSLTFTNSSILNDVRFHPCVRLRTWESNQTLSFIPPDGAFKLMSYRVMGLKNTPIYVKPQLSSGGGVCRVNVLVGTRYDTGKSVDSIIIRVPWPPLARSADLTANHGTVRYSHSTKVSTWTVGRIPKEKSPCLTGSVQLEAGLDRLVHFPTISVGFKIMGIAISGLQVGRAEVENAAYRTYKGFRSVTRAANYEIRT